MIPIRVRIGLLRCDSIIMRWGVLLGRCCIRSRRWTFETWRFVAGEMKSQQMLHRKQLMVWERWQCVVGALRAECRERGTGCCWEGGMHGGSGRAMAGRRVMLGLADQCVQCTRNGRLGRGGVDGWCMWR